jgi:hypothetical protein
MKNKGKKITSSIEFEILLDFQERYAHVFRQERMPFLCHAGVQRQQNLPDLLL